MGGICCTPEAEISALPDGTARITARPVCRVAVPNWFTTVTRRGVDACGLIRPRFGQRARPRKLQARYGWMVNVRSGSSVAGSGLGGAEAAAGRKAEAAGGIAKA
jgi:hypothetical protein